MAKETASSNNSTTAQQTDQDSANMPKSAKAVSLILHSMGVEDVEPRAVLQLLDFTYRTTADFLETAQTFSEHAGRSEIALDDLKLAIQTRVSTEFTGPPPRELLSEIAAERNKEPLPLITEKYGVRLPPERYCLTQPNYSILGPKQTELEDVHLTTQTSAQQVTFDFAPLPFGPS